MIYIIYICIYDKFIYVICMYKYVYTYMYINVCVCVYIYRCGLKGEMKFIGRNKKDRVERKD